tara:strand:+ start:4325 stop:5356 length:1032 start_codon:yes stop_codon:yes gene_type:complete
MFVKPRVGFAGLSHDHVWQLAASWSNQECELVAASDVNCNLRERMRLEFGVQQGFITWQEMLKGVDLDVLVVNMPNCDHADVVESAAALGIHCQVEKPMAATLEQARKMISASEDGSIALMVNWPTAWDPALRTAIGRAKSGEIGRIVRVLHRGGHAGPRQIGCSDEFCEWLYDPDQNGAGAYMDYSGYGIAVSLELLGRPNTVFAHMLHAGDDMFPGDDNAVLVLGYEDSLAVIECSWTFRGGASWATAIHGEMGSLFVDMKGQTLVQTNHTDKKIYEPDDALLQVALDQLPEGNRDPAEFFLRNFRSGEFDGPTSARFACEIQEIMDAGLRSASEHKVIKM